MFSPFRNYHKHITPNRSFFEYNGPELFPERNPLPFAIESHQRWRGPYLRIGNMRFKIERYTDRYKVENVPDRVTWQFHFYYERPNSFKGDRGMWGNLDS